jgi:hypothetical protein
MNRARGENLREDEAERGCWYGGGGPYPLAGEAAAGIPQQEIDDEGEDTELLAAPRKKTKLFLQIPP